MRGELRMASGQALFRGEADPRAIGTPFALPNDHRCRPLMSLGTAPPDDLVRTGGHPGGRERTVFRRMPLGRQVGSAFGKRTALHDVFRGFSEGEAYHNGAEGENPGRGNGGAVETVEIRSGFPLFPPLQQRGRPIGVGALGCLGTGQGMGRRKLSLGIAVRLPQNLMKRL